MACFILRNAEVDEFSCNAFLLGDAKRHDDGLHGIDGNVAQGSFRFFQGADGDVGKFLETLLDGGLKFRRQADSQAIAPGG